MITWRDITTYSKGDTEHIPTTIEGDAAGIKFLVHRHIDYGTKWLLTCTELNIDKEKISEKDIETAKISACETMSIYLEEKKNQIEEALTSVIEEVESYD